MENLCTVFGGLLRQVPFRSRDMDVDHARADPTLPSTGSFRSTRAKDDLWRRAGESVQQRRIKHELAMIYAKIVFIRNHMVKNEMEHSEQGGLARLRVI